MTTEEAHDLVRSIVAAVTATIADDGSVRGEALALLDPQPWADDLPKLLMQHELVISSLLTLVAGMTQLAGELQDNLTTEELVQKLALTFESRWSS